MCALCRHSSSEDVGLTESLSRNHRGLFHEGKCRCVMLCNNICRILESSVFCLHFFHEGCVTNDLAEVIARFDKGVRYKSHKDSQATGRMQIPFGQVISVILEKLLKISKQVPDLMI